MWSGAAGILCSLIKNLKKTKEIVVDFRSKTVTKPINIMSEEVGIVKHYKYLVST